MLHSTMDPPDATYRYYTTPHELQSYRAPENALSSHDRCSSSSISGSNFLDCDSYLQPYNSRPFKRRRSWLTLDANRMIATLPYILVLFMTLAEGAWVRFDNCLSQAQIESSNPQQLQWIPLWVDARLNETDPAHHLNLTMYGNVTGQATTAPLPPIDSPEWQNDAIPNGKIVDISPTNPKRTYTTLKSTYDVLTYTPFNSTEGQFCLDTVNVSCPLAPVFYGDIRDPYQFPAFTVGRDFHSSYAFTTIAATVRIVSGDQGFSDIACVSVNITPYLGSSIENLLSYLPLFVLVVVGVATAFVAMFSPWGSMNPFRWTSNYGRDEDLLRLVTPGFGDCLQYIQFIVLSGSLSLNYPGYFQPVISQVSWSALMFNQSFVSGGNGSQSLLDGVYATNGTYGMTRMSQLVGMTKADDLWAGMVIWLLVIIAALTVLCQLGFFLRWVFRIIMKQQKEDLRRQNWPFTAGNVVRLVCNFFLLPLVSLSMFQLVISSSSPAYITALDVILIVLVLAFGGWILYLVISTKPRSHLFDDLPTVLLYGPLYNTYSDNSAPFALVPFLITFIRGVAIGAVQPSGIAQLVILAICEVIYILTLYAFRPYQSPTSMNVYHTFFASIRLAVTLLCIAFAPPLGVTEAPKGWIGYVILLLHAVVLAFGFLLNALLKIVEIVARLAGAGGDEVTGAATRGGLRRVFGVRQLSRRAKRPGLRQSLASEHAILADDRDAEKRSAFGGRSRSMSASSAILLNQRATPTSRMSGHFDQYSTGDMGDIQRQDSHTFSYVPGAAIAVKGQKRPEVSPIDPYYRAPRARRHTGELITPDARSRDSASALELARKNTDDSPDQFDRRDSPIPQRSFSPQELRGPSPGFMRQRGDSDTNLNDPRRANVDYAVREVDFYYGVRGPALSSNQPTRKLKTGPADPVGPVSSATGWFRGMFGAKKKDSAKGFEVVRSTRAPPVELMMEDSPAQKPQEPYQDSPQSQNEAYIPGQRTRSNEEDREQVYQKVADDFADDDESTPVNSEDETGTNKFSKGSGSERRSERRVSDFVPTLGPIETGGSIKLPGQSGRTSNVATSNVSKESLPIGPVPDFAPSLGPIESMGGFELPSRFGSQRSHVPSRNVSNAAEASNRARREEQYGSRVSTVLESPERATPSPQPRLPFTGNSIHDRASAGADSSSDSRPSYSMGDRSELPMTPTAINPAADERPTSLGYVQQHRASDSIQPASAAFGGYLQEASSAEVVNTTPGTTPGHSSRPSASFSSRR